ncbi:MAG: ADP-dependent glucokinase/phosphofructokinase, partial [Candidatus Hinthialibacter sp.]
MPVAHWDRLYRNAYNHGVDRIRAIPGVCCAFHSVIDGLIRLHPDLIAPLLEKDVSLKASALKGCRGEAPMEIYSPEDFIQGLFYSLSKGCAMQRMIRTWEVHQWVLETFGPGEHRLGGTAGNMARSLAPLGIPVTVYANPLTMELAHLLGDYPNLDVIARQGDGFTKISPQEAAKDEGLFAIHWIFEYTPDFVMNLDGVRIQPHRANRYIPSWNPINNQFRMSVEFAQGFLALIESYSHLLFSGFHILSERYPDCSTCVDVVKPLSDYLGVVRKRSPHLKIHLELASIASLMIRRAVSRDIIPHVHS